MSKTRLQINEVLAEFGLSDVEANVYQAALALGSRPASLIAQRAGLKRGHGYNVLQSLMEKGLIQEFVKNGVRHFTCSPPESLLSIARHREDELRRAKEKLVAILPDLDQIRSPLNAQPKVRLYPGLEGIREIYEDTLRTPDLAIRCMIDFETAWSSVLPSGAEYAADYVRRRNELGVFWYGLMVENAAAHRVLALRPSNLRKVKLAPGLKLPAEITIYGPKLAYISARDEYVGVVIENEAITQTVRNIFEFLWKRIPSPVLDR